MTQAVMFKAPEFSMELRVVAGDEKFVATIDPTPTTDYVATVNIWHDDEGLVRRWIAARRLRTISAMYTVPQMVLDVAMQYAHGFEFSQLEEGDLLYCTSGYWGYCVGKSEIGNMIIEWHKWDIAAHSPVADWISKNDPNFLRDILLIVRSKTPIDPAQTNVNHLIAEFPQRIGEGNVRSCARILQGKGYAPIYVRWVPA